MDKKTQDIKDEMIEQIANEIIKDLKEEPEEDLIEKIDSLMSKLSKKYMDERDYVQDLKGLYNELKEVIPEINARRAIFNLYFNNMDIIVNLRNKNNNEEKLKKLKEQRKTLIDYKKEEEKKDIKEQKEQKKESIDISFYIEFIENIDNDSYLNLLPNNNDKESLLIIDTLLAHYIKEINTLKYLLSISHDDYYMNQLNRYTSIFNTIINYKNTLLNVKKEEKVIENQILYYMNGNTSYLLNDILEYPEIYESINNLIKSIKKGNFKNIRYFTNNGKTKGLVEVRDIRNCTRVLFDIVGYKKYCIIGAIVGKKETNSIYKDRLISRYSKYKLDKENCLLEDKELSKILRGVNNG